MATYNKAICSDCGDLASKHELEEWDEGRCGACTDLRAEQQERARVRAVARRSIVQDKFLRAMGRKWIGYKVRTYSGRGMYGAVCLGVTLPVGEARQLLARTRMGLAADSMGLDMIVYCPTGAVRGEV